MDELCSTSQNLICRLVAGGSNRRLVSKKEYQSRRHLQQSEIWRKDPLHLRDEGRTQRTSYGDLFTPSQCDYCTMGNSLGQGEVRVCIFTCTSRGVTVEPCAEFNSQINLTIADRSFTWTKDRPFVPHTKPHRYLCRISAVTWIKLTIELLYCCLILHFP